MVEKMNKLEYFHGGYFADLSELQKAFVTLVKPMVENELNEIIEHHNSDENQIQDEGIALAIRRYGLRPASLRQDDAQPSSSKEVSEPEIKKKKVELTDQETKDILFSAVYSAIERKGLMI